MPESSNQLRRLDEIEAEVMRSLEERGALRHLYGQPLDLHGDAEYLANKTLKAQGFTHPVLERAREIDAPSADAERILFRLQRRRDWLSEGQTPCTCQQVADFNQHRERELERYRQRLEVLNRVIRDFNLGAPGAVHRRPVNISGAVESARQAIPPLPWPRGETSPHRGPTRWRLFRRNNH